MRRERQNHEFVKTKPRIDNKDLYKIRYLLPQKIFEKAGWKYYCLIFIIHMTGKDISKPIKGNSGKA